MQHRRDIDGLRALAVGAVVIDHALPDVLPGGFVGVDIFFVLSGFLITSIIARELDQGRFSLAAFYERRARRILPALFFLLIVWGGIGWALFPPDVYAAFGKSAVATLVFSSNIWFWHATGDYFALGAKLEPLLHTWSLGVEEQYYVVFPMILMALWRWKNLRILALWGLVAGSFALSVWGVGTAFTEPAAPLWSFFWLPTRAWELGLGALLALGAFGAAPGGRAASLWAIAGLCAIFASMVFLSATTPFPGLAALPVCLGTVLILWTGGATGRETGVSRGLGIPPLVGIGLISYSLYLWHWPPLVLARLWVSSTILPLPLALLCIVGAVFAAWVSWRWVETPLRNRRVVSNRLVVGLTTSVGGALLALGGMIHLANGFPGRLSPQVGEIYASAISPQLLAEDCQAQGRRGEACWIGAGPAGDMSDFVIWGDSHAMALLPGFHGWLGERGLKARAQVHGGCPPLPGIIRSGTPQEVEDCISLNEGMLMMLENSTPKTVVLVARWRFIRSGHRTPGESGDPFVIRPVDAALADLDQTALFDRLFEDLVTRLGKSGHRVVIIEAVPEIGADVPQAMVMAALRRKALVAPLPGTLHRERMAETRDFLDRMSRLEGVVLRDPAPVLCAERCAIQRNGELLYRDDDHLSEAGARFLVPRLMESL